MIEIGKLYMSNAEDFTSPLYDEVDAKKVIKALNDPYCGQNTIHLENDVYLHDCGDGRYFEKGDEFNRYTMVTKAVSLDDDGDIEIGEVVGWIKL